MEMFISPIAILIYIGLGIPAFFAFGIWRKTRPGYLNAVFLDATETLKSSRVVVTPDGKSFSKMYKKRPKKYKVDNDCIYRVGIWRVPTSYYYSGVISPINFKQKGAVESVTAEDYFEATESNVIRQALQAFDESLVSLTTSMVVVIVVVVIANGIVYIQLKNLLDAISTGLGLNPNG